MLTSTFSRPNSKYECKRGWSQRSNHELHDSDAMMSLNAGLREPGNCSYRCAPLPFAPTNFVSQIVAGQLAAQPSVITVNLAPMQASAYAVNLEASGRALPALTLLCCHTMHMQAVIRHKAHQCQRGCMHLHLLIVQLSKPRLYPEALGLITQVKQHIRLLGTGIDHAEPEWVLIW